MKCKLYRFDEIAINHDKKRVPISSMERAKRQGGYRYYGAQGVIDYIDDYLFDGTYLLIAEDGENLKSNKQKIAQIVDGQFWVNNHAHIIQTNEKCNLRFLYYLINVTDLSGYITGSAQPKLSQANLNAIELRIPERSVQDKIVSILKILDDKIELNDKINDNLQQQADLIYDNIFTEETNFAELGTVVETTSGGTPSRKCPELYESPSVSWVKSKELSGGFVHNTEEEINELALTKSSAKILPSHSVLVAMYGATVGEYGIIASPMTCNQAICALIPNVVYPYQYLYELIRHSKEQLKNMAVGSAQQNISQILIRQLPIHKDIHKIERYCKATTAFFQIIESLTLENFCLASLRDTLLPKLLSGEIDISNINL